MSQKPKKTRAEQLFREAELKEESRDRKGSFLAMKESAELGYRMAQVNLGNMYASGWGTAKDRNRAEYWYKASFRQGSSTGALNMGVDLQKQGRIRSAKIWLKRAASMGNGKALVLLAKLYLEHGPPKNNAKELLTSALNSDSISDLSRDEAKKLLRRMAKHAANLKAR